MGPLGLEGTPDQKPIDPWSKHGTLYQEQMGPFEYRGTPGARSGPRSMPVGPLEQAQGSLKTNMVLLDTMVPMEQAGAPDQEPMGPENKRDPKSRANVAAK